ncbi:sugar ABC transporter substrate-binding protein [Clostridium oryzae]|uniref:Maltodextrin-binding protein MdxE n=1 Tax=Clostridium oryzae TaxID=1450648 RepID=A0A1V4IWM9_9CLOT|nr:extracellular solute-binding protein [Clostridium oryzae]OPJ64458.1 maltodextrin-binding protein MdxE precursor [Clostridium oryzae]
MKLKKILTAFVSMAVMSSLAACSSSKGSVNDDSGGKKNITLTVWHQYLPDTEKLLINSFKDFTKQTGIKLKFEKQENIDNKIEIGSQSGKLPDIIIRSNDMVGKLTVMGAIKPLNGLISKSDLKNTMKTAIDGFTYRGKLYGVPGHLETVTLIYNKDLIPEPPKTMDELLQKAKQLSKDNKFGFLIPPKDPYFNSCFFNGSNKDKYLTTDGKASLNTPENIETLKYLKQLSKYYPKDLDNQMVSQLFDDKKVAMMISGPWDIAKLKQLKINYGLALIPISSNTNEPAAPFVSVQGMMMTSSCKDEQAAAKVLKYYLGENVAMAYFKSGGYMPSNSSVYNKAEVKADKDILAFKAQAEVGIAQPNIPEMGVMWQPATDLLQGTIVLRQDPQKTAEKFQKRAEDAISNMK